MPPKPKTAEAPIEFPRAEAPGDAVSVSKLLDGEKSYELKLTRAAAVGLAAMVRSSGWAKTVKLVRRAGKLCRRLAPLVKEPAHVDAAAAEAWAEETLHLSMGERDREACKEVVKHFIGRGALENTIHTATLLDELGLVEE